MFANCICVQAKEEDVGIPNNFNLSITSGLFTVLLIFLKIKVRVIQKSLPHLLPTVLPLTFSRSKKENLEEIFLALFILSII